MDAETSVDAFVGRCWDKISQSGDFIYVWQVSKLIEEFEKKLGTKGLLKQVEKNLLNEMIQDKPTLKLHRKEAKDFLLKLSQCSDMVKFFAERSGISKTNLMSLLDKPTQSSSRAPLSPSKYDGELNTSTPIEKPAKPSFKPNASMPPSPVPLRRPFSQTRPISVGNELMKERQVNERDDYISIMTKENDELRSSNQKNLGEIRSLQASNQSLKSYVESLEVELKQANQTNRHLALGSKGGTSQEVIVKDLIRQCDERDKTIKMLEQMCEQYQQEFSKLKEDSSIANLMKNVNEQNQLINNLKEKLHLSETNETTGEFERFISKIPVLKQYLMFYRYKKQSQTVGMVVLNVVILTGTFYTVMAMLRISYFILLTILGGRDTTFDYVYEDYGSWGQDEGRVGIMWWKELPWLEYAIYNLDDWFER